MTTEISNGQQTIKLYRSVNRGKPMYQLSYYIAGKRIQRNFSDKWEAKRVARVILGGMVIDATAIDALSMAELESFVAARRVLAPNYALHIAVEEHAQAVAKLGKVTLREAVEFFRRHHVGDAPPLTLSEIAEKFAASREQSGLSSHYVFVCRKTMNDLAKAFALLHDTARVALEAGNSPQMIFMHYRELVTPEAAKAWFEVKPS